jgi:hypothetical protein
MEKNIIKLEDLKNGMRLRSVKNVYYVSKGNLDEGIMLEEELKNELSCIISVGEIKEVLIEDEEGFLIDIESEESNEGWYGVEDMLKKGVFEII